MLILDVQRCLILQIFDGPSQQGDLSHSFASALMSGAEPDQCCPSN
jgi:hypothetical protein